MVTMCGNARLYRPCILVVHSKMPCVPPCVGGGRVNTIQIYNDAIHTHVRTVCKHQYCNIVGFIISFIQTGLSVVCGVDSALVACCVTANSCLVAATANHEGWLKQSRLPMDDDGAMHKHIQGTLFLPHQQLCVDSTCCINLLPCSSEFVASEPNRDGLHTFRGCGH
jgi:hypothetical protein